MTKGEQGTYAKKHVGATSESAVVFRAGVRHKLFSAFATGQPSEGDERCYRL